MRSGASRRIFLRSLCFASISAGASPLAPPSLTSEAASADLVELYWRSLTLDIPFDQYPSSPLLASAARELHSHPGYSGTRTVPTPPALSSLLRRANLRTQRDLVHFFTRTSPEVPFLEAASVAHLDSRHVLQILRDAARAANDEALALKQRHNRPRPAVMAARLHDHITNSRRLPFPVSLTNSRGLELSARATGSFLLRPVVSNVSPLSPSFPNSHAAVASACATVLSSFSSPRLASELDQLASDIAFARDSAALNFRSDTVAGLALGRSVAREILRSA